MERKCGTCKSFTGAGDFDLCCLRGIKRLCYKNTDACEKWEESPIKHRYIITRDNEVIMAFNDLEGMHPVSALAAMICILFDEMGETAQKLSQKGGQISGSDSEKVGQTEA